MEVVVARDYVMMGGWGWEVEGGGVRRWYGDKESLMLNSTSSVLEHTASGALYFSMGTLSVRLAGDRPFRPRPWL